MQIPNQSVPVTRVAPCWMFWCVSCVIACLPSPQHPQEPNLLPVARSPGGHLRNDVKITLTEAENKLFQTLLQVRTSVSNSAYCTGTSRFSWSCFVHTTALEIAALVMLVCAGWFSPTALCICVPPVVWSAHFRFFRPLRSPAQYACCAQFHH